MSQPDGPHDVYGVPGVNQTATFCFTLTASAGCAAPDSPCCNMPLSKVEILVSESQTPATATTGQLSGACLLLA